MKLRLLISIFFIIATTAVAIHELEHIHGGGSSSCQICVVDEHSVSADIVDTIKDIEILKFNGVITGNLVHSLHIKNHSYQNRAPPFRS